MRLNYSQTKHTRAFIGVGGISGYNDDPKAYYRIFCVPQASYMPLTI